MNIADMAINRKNIVFVLIKSFAVFAPSPSYGPLP
jgi:hypothetical protein